MIGRPQADLVVSGEQISGSRPAACFSEATYQPLNSPTPQHDTLPEWTSAAWPGAI